MDNQNSQKISLPLLVFNLVLVLLIIIMVFLVYSAVQKPKIKIAKEQNKIVAVTSAFDDLNLEAKAAYVFDVLNNRIVYEKNEERQLPLASLTKLMTALTALDLLPANSRITIKKEFLTEQNNTGIVANETWKLKDLLDFSLIVSSNDGMRSIASVVGANVLQTNNYDLGRIEFVKKMNDKAKELGLNQTYFINESGLDEGNFNGGYGSAKDVAELMRYLLINKPEILESTRSPFTTINSVTKTHLAKNTNTDVGQIPNLLASKTGYTDIAQGNLAIAFDPSIGRPIIVVVLGSSEKGRFTDVEQLVKASFNYIKE